MTRWDFEQNREAKMLAMLQALTGQAGQYGGTTQGTQTTTSSSNPLGQAFGLGMMGLSMYMNPAGAAGGMASSAGNCESA